MNNYSTFKGTEESILNLIKPLGFDICPVCREIVIYNSCIPTCGHKHCNKCLQELLIQGKLKITRSVSDDGDSNNDNDKYIQEYKCSMCRKRQTDIPLRLSITDLKHKIYSCLSNKCNGERFTLKEFEDHVFYKCPDRKILCKEDDIEIDCKEEIKSSQYKAHIDKHLKIRDCLHAFLDEDEICFECGVNIKKRHLICI